MQTSDWINVALCILSFVLSIVSVGTAIATLLQNRQMIENATRPYVAISYETVCVAPNKNNRYIVVKNYGQTAAEIKEIDCLGVQDDLFLRQLSNLVGGSLAPQQRRMYSLQGRPVSGGGKHATFTITYCGNRKKYSESTTLQLNSGSLVYRSAEESYALQEIAERLL